MTNSKNDWNQTGTDEDNSLSSGQYTLQTTDWADNCSDATVVSADGQYTGTLSTSDDDDHFKVELSRGEYLTVDASVPTDSGTPAIFHNGDFTLRSVSNVSQSGDNMYLEPGIEGTYEVWAEADTTICFDVDDYDEGAGYPYDWDLSLTKTDPGITDQWASSCSDASVVDSTGTYDGTLITPGDDDHFKVELSRGEYLTVDASVPTDSGTPAIFHNGDFTLRSVSNVSQSGDNMYLEPGFESTYEVWAEANTTICFDVDDYDEEADYPYDWDLSLTKTDPGIADQWASSCSDASVVDSTGTYDGTLITPGDDDHLRVQLDRGEYLTVDASVPTDSGTPAIFHNGDFTLRPVSNVSQSGDNMYLEPGFESTYEVWAEADTTICFDVDDYDEGAGYPYDWDLSLTKTDPGIADQWASSCSDASVVDSDSRYNGTLITPGDDDHFRHQLNSGDYLSVDASVPNAAKNPVIYHTGDITLRSVSNASKSGQTIYLEPGIEGTYEVEANSDTIVCFDVDDYDESADYPYNWDIGLGTNGPPPEPSVSVSSSGDSIGVGGQAEITISAEAIEQLTVQKLWADWKLSDYQSDGAQFTDSISVDGQCEFIWDTNQTSVSTSLTLTPPDRYIGGEYGIEVVAVGSDSTAESTAILQVS